MNQTEFTNFAFTWRALYQQELGLTRFQAERCLHITTFVSSFLPPSEIRKYETAVNAYEAVFIGCFTGKLMFEDRLLMFIDEDRPKIYWLFIDGFALPRNVCESLTMLACLLAKGYAERKGLDMMEVLLLTHMAIMKNSAIMGPPGGYGVRLN